MKTFTRIFVILILLVAIALLLWPRSTIGALKSDASSYIQANVVR